MNSERRRALTIAAAIATLIAPAGAVAAQGVVSGAVTITQRPGAERADLRTAVVYLEPRGARVSLASASGSGGAGGAPSRASIAMRGREFYPHVQPVMAGGSVAFPNEDPFSHNVFTNVELGPFDLGCTGAASRVPRPSRVPGSTRSTATFTRGW